MKKMFRLTKAGVEELQQELDSLMAKRGDIADAIKSARELGDLTENAEYQSALVEKDRNEARISELQNILQNPHVGLLFLIPGMDETLRVNGSAVLVQDDDLLGKLAVDGKPPQLAIVVHVEEAFLHCGRSSLRAQVWDPTRYMARDEMPSLSRMIADQTRPTDRAQAEHERVVQEGEARTAESYRCLY